MVVPLDAHLELYAYLDKSAASAASEVSFKRTDLALVDLDLAQRLITVSLVEVKCLRRVGRCRRGGNCERTSRSRSAKAKKSFAITSTRNWPSPTGRTAPSKTRQLARLLEYYLARSHATA